jgi:glucokinase
MKYTIGLDLGGTNSVFGIVDAEGKIIEQASIKTKGYDDADTYVKAAMNALLPIIKNVGGLEYISSMGIGAPNGNIISGCVEYAPNIAWAHDCVVPLAKMFSDKLNGLPVTLTNDANAAAMGEMKFGVAKGMKDFIVLTLGTGVGSGIVCNGELVYGSDGNAGELGHLLVKPGDRLCGCGRRGCLETYCSATGVVRTAKQFLSESDEPSLLRDIPIDEITSYDVSMAAQKGDAISNKIFDFTGKIMGEACANMAVFSSPEAFIFFGGLAKAGELLLAPIRKTYDEIVMPIYKNKAKFLLSTLDGANAAVLGAASIVK